MPSNIHELPQQLIDQIKAGEVIERPGYLIKELLENSIDAKANEIFIHIINNGLELIHIRDNGIGMSIEDLPLAFKRHSTSKISRFDDLYNLGSYGFRGEALASIAAVSKLVCESKNGKDQAARIEFIGGQQSFLSSSAKKNQGSEFFVKDLFFNTPVRLKFISSIQAEKNFIKRVLMAFFISHPQITFNLRIDDEDIKIFPATEDKAKRIQDCYHLFERYQSNFERTQKSYDGIHLEIYKSSQSNLKNISAQKNFIFINDRMVQNAQIHNIVSQIIMNHMESYPRFVLSLDIPSSQIDVNVHPNKTFIKFFEPNKIIALVKGAISEDYKNQSTLKTKGSYEPGELSESLDYTSEELSDHTFNIADSDFILLMKDQKTFICKKSALIKYLIHQNITDENHNPVPLLISEPIEASLLGNEQKILEEIGFELDPLDANTFALRSYPLFLSDYPYLQILKDIIPHLKKIKTLPEFFKTYLGVESAWGKEIPSALVPKDLIQTDWANLVEMNIVRTIPSDSWEKFFEK